MEYRAVIKKNNDFKFKGRLNIKKGISLNLVISAFLLFNTLKALALGLFFKRNNTPSIIGNLLQEQETIP